MVAEASRLIELKSEVWVSTQPKVVQSWTLSGVPDILKATTSGAMDELSAASLVCVAFIRFVLLPSNVR